MTNYQLISFRTWKWTFSVLFIWQISLHWIVKPWSNS